MKKTPYIGIGIAVLTVLAAGAYHYTLGSGKDMPLRAGVDATPSEEATKVTMYKSPLCGCCVKYAPYLEAHGYEVDMVSTEDMSAVKEASNIPHDMQSCHTMQVGPYVVEGHVPVEAIDKLLAEEPAIDGIALPAMPAGSPGMPGIKRGPFEIRALVDGNVSPFMSI